MGAGPAVFAHIIEVQGKHLFSSPFKKGRYKSTVTALLSSLCYPFTPEIATDSMMYLWKKKNSRRVGIRESTEAAMIRG